MHLQAVLVLVDGLGHAVELTGLVQFVGCSAVNGQVTQWRGVVRTAGQGGLGEVVVVRWS